MISFPHIRNKKTMVRELGMTRKKRARGFCILRTRPMLFSVIDALIQRYGRLKNGRLKNT